MSDTVTLCAAFRRSSPSLESGGSKKKGTENRTGTDLLEPEPNRNRSSGTVNNMTVVTKKIKRVEQDNIVVCDSDSEESEGNKENDEADFF